MNEHLYSEARQQSVGGEEKPKLTSLHMQLEKFPDNNSQLYQ